jgi:hypothetical protein
MNEDLRILRGQIKGLEKRMKRAREEGDELRDRVWANEEMTESLLLAVFGTSDKKKILRGAIIHEDELKAVEAARIATILKRGKANEG